MADDRLRHVKETPREYMLRIYDTIDQHGWVVQSVFDNDDTAFAYTIGLTPKGLPELFIDQLNPQQAGMILNAAAARLVDGTLTLVGGQDIDADLEFSVNFRFRGPIKQRVAGANLISNVFPLDKAVVWQVLWPDKEGRFPGDAGYEMNAQRLIVREETPPFAPSWPRRND